jgi:hypothetical protein
MFDEAINFIVEKETDQLEESDEGVTDWFKGNKHWDNGVMVWNNIWAKRNCFFCQDIDSILFLFWKKPRVFRENPVKEKPSKGNRPTSARNGWTWWIRPWIVHREDRVIH